MMIVILSHYYIVPNLEKKEGCNYDYRSGGINTAQSFTCPDEEEYCKGMSFYNSEYYIFKGSDHHQDYFPSYFSDNHFYCQSNNFFYQKN